MIRTLFVLIAVTVVTGLVFHESPETGLAVATDGVIAAAILAAATGPGMWCVAGLGLGREPLRWQVLLGAGLGIGGLMLLMLGGSLLGLLNRWVWLAVLVGMFAAGVARMIVLVRRRPKRTDPSTIKIETWLWLLAMPALALVLLVAAVPTGFLWIEEARGYDVLEYHLGAPKEYFLAGRNTYLPHNVYANFPFNVEMLYLLAMVLDQDPWSAAPLAKMLNAGLAILTVAAVWLAAREFSRTAGIVAGIVVGTLPWLMYLSGLCFVENGMLFFGALAMACWCRAVTQSERADDATAPRWAWALASGLTAGLSAGCKYTGAAMFAVPIALAWGAYAWPRRSQRLGHVALFALGTVLTLSPWLVKNARMTGNPVFPLAYSVFGAHDDLWDDALDAQWRAAHTPQAEQQTLTARTAAFWQQVVGEARFNAIPGAIFALALVGGLVRARWIGGLLLVVLAVQICVWFFFTHLFARFAVPAAIPVAILCGRAVSAPRARTTRGLMTAGVVAVCLANLYPSWQLYYDHLRFGGRLPGSLPHAQIRSAVDSWVNAHVPADGYVLLVGEARAYFVRPRVDYCVVFNRNAFAEAIASAESDSAVVDWLALRGYTHVAVHWPEMARLRRTYGFWPAIDRALFDRLEAAGLKGVANPVARDGAEPFATVYEVPRP